MESIGFFWLQIGYVGAEILFALLPETALRTWIERLERALHDHPALATPAMELEPQLDDLHEPFVGFALPVIPRNRSDGLFDVGGELEFEEE